MPRAKYAESMETRGKVESSFRLLEIRGTGTRVRDFVVPQPP